MTDTSINNNEGTKTNLFAKSCPYLGTNYDPTVCFSYPTNQNCCHKLDHPTAIAFNHQDNHCLSNSYTTCEIYKQTGTVKKAPKEILIALRVKKKRVGNGKKTLLFILGIIVMGMIFSLAFLNYYGLNNGYFANTNSNSAEDQSLSNNETNTPTINDELDIFFLFPRKSPTSDKEDMSTEVENTPTPTAGPPFGKVLNPDGSYLLHQVSSGESVHYLANLYDSTANTISQLNCLPAGSPIVVNQVLVIKSGEKQTTISTCYSVIQIEQETPLETIASNYQTTSEELIRLNNLGAIHQIPAGRWLIVPQN